MACLAQRGQGLVHGVIGQGGEGRHRGAVGQYRQQRQQELREFSAVQPGQPGQGGQQGGGLLRVSAGIDAQRATIVIHGIGVEAHAVPRLQSVDGQGGRGRDQ